MEPNECKICTNRSMTRFAAEKVYQRGHTMRGAARTAGVGMDGRYGVVEVWWIRVAWRGVVEGVSDLCDVKEG